MNPKEGIESKAARWREVLSPHLRPVPRPDGNRTALLVIDCQVHFEEMIRPILPNLRRIVEHFRERGRPVIFTRHRHKDPAVDGGMMAEWWDDLLIDGEPDAELIPDLRPREGEGLIEKSRYSAFLHTPLEDELRRLGIQDLIVSGVMTHLCCETTARDAFMRDFRVFFLFDATATDSEEHHLSTLRNLAHGFAYLTTCPEILAAL